ncbi:hypothetical protein Pla100_56910 [Neorhodopirellula pilleata]|uniref:Uncharacterized protein n=1 Tax=Neorhodopirellula pilleata TaxID=2714738 RepID=A0A5C5ZSN1_9BACT|nr:hypothetical protein Pla100_56910 [Neorhodopirellula pilleata]
MIIAVEVPDGDPALQSRPLLGSLVWGRSDDLGDIAPQRLLTWHPVAEIATASSLLNW